MRHSKDVRLHFCPTCNDWHEGQNHACPDPRGFWDEDCMQFRFPTVFVPCCECGRVGCKGCTASVDSGRGRLLCCNCLAGKLDENGEVTYKYEKRFKDKP